MKKKMTLLLLIVLAGAFVLQTGCGGDDDPADPGQEDCTITVTGPVAGEQYLSGEQVRITWNEQGSAAEVEIELLKAGQLVGSIGTVNNDGYQGWDATTMGAVSGDDFSVRVTAVGESGCGDTSGEFAITNTVGCNLAFTFPDTSSLDEGQEFEITWESENTTGFVEIELMRQDQSVGYVASNTPDDGSYLWTVDSLHEGTYAFYYLRISDRTVAGCEAESQMFNINDENVCEFWIGSPQGTENWQEGQTVTLSFTAPYTDTDAVHINLYQGTQLVTNITNNLAITDHVDPTEISWTVTLDGFDSPSNEYRIKIGDAGDINCVTWSETFVIMGN